MSLSASVAITGSPMSMPASVFSATSLVSVSDSNMGTVIMAVTIMVAGESSMAMSVPAASVYVAITRR